ncbi:hypothetical protein BMF35_a0615 [Aurantiacibacter gangjinensis]|nr:hypothetical protein BMF35_a0615 [Aurantiacibacter gangjinensis]
MSVRAEPVEARNRAGFANSPFDKLRTNGEWVARSPGYRKST